MEVRRWPFRVVLILDRLIQRDKWREEAQRLAIAGVKIDSEPDWFGTQYGVPIDTNLSIAEQLEQWNTLVQPMAEALLDGRTIHGDSI